ncbi:D-aspartate oxidase-like [Anopheles albimanus]|uniref:FAD dependent oxidoreductase domain-containing protein n=1 Tax=Anopheles albimanus TaxID=7167 RepID=A0A182FSM0_ANOAL|nr:D-aspartate oxidase-like [Anopheles albimanus]
MRYKFGMNRENKQFLILGGGINGLSCAMRLLEAFPNAVIQIMAEDYSPNTTSDIAAGLWGPYLLGQNDNQIYRTWAQDTHDYFHTLWRGGQADECGICLVPVLEVSGNHEPTPWWHDIVFGFQRLTSESLQQLTNEHKPIKHYATGFAYTTFTCEPTKLMNYYRHVLMMQRNVSFHKKKLSTMKCLDSLGIVESTIIINCFGLGAKTFSRDPNMTPIRGQVQKIESPGIFLSFANDYCYIIPNTDSITLGGTKQKSTDTRVCPLDRSSIRNNCETIVPSLQHARLVRDVVGLRPLRSTGVRLQVDLWHGLSGRKRIVHNYGHGGAGISLAWGCAGAVVQLVQQWEHNFDNGRSKL